MSRYLARSDVVNTMTVYENVDMLTQPPTFTEKGTRQVETIPDMRLVYGQAVRLDLSLLPLATKGWNWFRGIHQLQLTTLAVLNLNDGGLTELPSQIGDIATLVRLRVHSNSLETLPDSVGRLKNLEVLSAYSNNMTSLPDSLRQLGHLKVLRLGGNLLDADNISIFVGSRMLKSLKELYLRENRLLYTTEIPRDIRSETREGLFLDTSQCPTERPDNSSSCTLI